MKISHIAIWTRDLERSREFYATYFQAMSGAKYENSSKGFSSYFLSFDGGCRLEIMKMASMGGGEDDFEERLSGISHFAVSVGSKQKVDEMTESLRENGFIVASDPRETGDGYYLNFARVGGFHLSVI